MRAGRFALLPVGCVEFGKAGWGGTRQKNDHWGIIYLHVLLRLGLALHALSFLDKGDSRLTKDVLQQVQLLFASLPHLGLPCVLIYL